MGNDAGSFPEKYDMGADVQRRIRQVPTTTGFFRNAAQLAALATLVPRPTLIYVFGCSDGSETYSVAIQYRMIDPDLRPRIEGYDIEESALNQARQAAYGLRQLDYYRDGGFPAAPWARWLQPDAEGGWHVEDSVRQSCRFGPGDILDETFMGALPPADVVFCQNVLVHLPVTSCAKAVRLLAGVVGPSGVLVIGGMKPAVRQQITVELGLVPVTLRCREIHDGWREQRRAWSLSWPWSRPVYALEPFRKGRGWENRFSTIFRVPAKRGTP